MAYQAIHGTHKHYAGRLRFWHHDAVEDDDRRHRLHYVALDFTVVLWRLGLIGYVHSSEFNTNCTEVYYLNSEGEHDD
jgi:hypothetical protein